jgi:type IV pilus assembly protein PilZ
MSKPGLLTLTIRDKSALYLAYMPFIRNGGLFIPTSSSYRIGDEVFMLLNIMGEDEKIPVAGRVIWVTPKGAQGKRTAGIGVQFSDQDNGTTQKKLLAETSQLTRCSGRQRSPRTCSSAPTGVSYSGHRATPACRSRVR